MTEHIKLPNKVPSVWLDMTVESPPEEMTDEDLAQFVRVLIALKEKADRELERRIKERGEE